MASATPEAYATGPDQDVAPLIDRHALALDAFVFDILQGRLVELELPLEGAGRQATSLAQEGDHLIQDGYKVHRGSSLPGCLASVP